MKRLILLLISVAWLNTISAQWNTNTLVNLELAALPLADMQTLTTSTGKTWIAFYHQNAGNYDMRAQLLDVNGVKLLGSNGVLVSNKTSGSATYVFNICKDASDNLIIAFQDQRNGPISAVIYKISQAGAPLWGVDGVVLGEGLAPYPGVLSNNEVAVSWIESISNTLNLQKITVAGALAWATPVQVKVGTTLTTRGQVVPNLGSNFNLIFQKRGTGISTTLYSQRYNSSGTPIWAAPLQICTETTAGIRYYSVTAENDTTYCGYYSSVGSRFNSWLQRINPDGTIPFGASGSNFSTSTSGSDPYQQNTNIALIPGSPYVWSLCSYSNTAQSQYGVYVQKFAKSDGSRLFGASALNVYPISPSFDTQSGTVSLVNDAPVFMSYDAAYKIYATRLDANGAFVWSGNRVELSSTTAGGSTPKGRFGFTALSNRQAVALWYENRGVEYRGYAQNITPGGLFALVVGTQGSVSSTITTPAGTLQMTANIFPATANQAVTWSIVTGTGIATISTSGLVTAQTNGTVWAKAVSVVDNTVSDSLLITITGQAGVTVTSIIVSTQGSVPAAINSAGGTLQMVATLLPANANQAVTWSIVVVTGNASISTTGLVTAASNGTVWAKAVSVQTPSMKDSLLITISNQPIPVTSIIVSTQGSVPAVINTAGGTLQMVATLLPANANQAVTWSMVVVTGNASISTTGLVTAASNGTVWAKAVSVQTPSMKDSLLITISNQPIPVTSIIVSTQGSVPAVINTAGGTLQMVATLLPANANQAVTWSMVVVTGNASISTTGLVTAASNGTVWAKAVSVQTPSKKDSLLITISNQPIPVTALIVSTQASVPAIISINNGSLQMVATIVPANASNTAVTWSLINVSGSATISNTGLVTAQTNGTVWAKAVSVSNSAAKDSLLITISNQFVPLVSLVVKTLGNVPATITSVIGTLQMVAIITPSNATNQAVTWSIVPATGTATISNLGLVTAQSSGTVWAKAVSISNPTLKDSLLITINIEAADSKLLKMIIYPNPATVLIHLKLLQSHPAITLFITDAIGRVVHKEILSANVLRNEYIVGLRKFPKGFYIIYFKGTGIAARFKFVKQ